MTLPCHAIRCQLEFLSHRVSLAQGSTYTKGSASDATALETGLALESREREDAVVLDVDGPEGEVVERVALLLLVRAAVVVVGGRGELDRGVGGPDTDAGQGCRGLLQHHGHGEEGGSGKGLHDWKKLQRESEGLVWNMEGSRRELRC